MKKLTINKMQKISDNLYLPFSEEIVASFKKLPNKIREELYRLNIGENIEENKNVIINNMTINLIVRLGELLDMRCKLPQHDSLKHICEVVTSENQSIH
jgi:hypothetical protein